MARAQVTLVIEAKIKPGRIESMRELFAEMSAATQASEPGCLLYEYYIDGANVHLLERYESSEAGMVHLGNFGAKFADRFMGGLTIERCAFYGTPSDALRDGVVGLNPIYFPFVVGFQR